MKRNERSKPRIPIHFKRITAVLEFNLPESEGDPKATPGQTEKTMVRIVLRDLSTHGVGVYSATLLAKGLPIKLAFTYPVKITIPGKIMWSQEFNVNSHVLTDQAFPYRAGIEFTLASEEEKQSVANFYAQLAQDR